MEETNTQLRRAGTRLRTQHEAVIGSIDDCAERVATSWADDRVGDRRLVVEPFRTTLEDRGVLAELPTVLADVVEHLGYDLPATPVAAPPYVVVTSRGLLLRATLPPGRLVIAVECFEVCRDPDPFYRRPEGATVDVELE